MDDDTGRDDRQFTDQIAYGAVEIDVAVRVGLDWIVPVAIRPLFRFVLLFLGIEANVVRRKAMIIRRCVQLAEMNIFSITVQIDSTCRKRCLCLKNGRIVRWANVDQRMTMIGLWRIGRETHALRTASIDDCENSSRNGSLDPEAVVKEGKR